MWHPVLDSEAGEVVEYVGTAADITELRQAEEERERLRQLEADLAHMNRLTMLGELASSLPTKSISLLLPQSRAPMPARVGSHMTHPIWKEPARPQSGSRRTEAVQPRSSSACGRFTRKGLRRIASWSISTK